MRQSNKKLRELRKQALKLSDAPRREKFRALVLFLLGLLCIFYLFSFGKKWMEDRIALSKIIKSEIRVEVLNGTDISGLAEAFANKLRANGFDVVGYDNADKKVETTVILDRKDIELKNAKLVKRVIGQGKLSFEPHPTGLLEVTVVLGKDLKVRKKTEITQ